MKNFIKILDKYVQVLFEGDKEKIKTYYDFAMLYLGRYENICVGEHSLINDDTAVINLRESESSELGGRVLINPDGVGIMIGKTFFDFDGTPICSIDEMISFNDKGFDGWINDFVYDESGIEYSGLPGIENNMAYKNTGDICNVSFTNKGIINDKNEYIKRFNTKDTTVIFSQLMEHMDNLKNKIYEGFYVDEYNVVNINVASSESEVSQEKTKNNITDRILSLYMTVCNEYNTKEIDFIVNNVDIIEIMLNRYQKKCYYGDEMYNDQYDVYYIPIELDAYNYGFIYVRPDEINFELIKKYPGTDEQVEDVLNLKENNYEGLLSVLFKINKQEGIHFLKSNIAFTNYGILDETTIPFCGNTNQEKINEVDEMFRAQIDALLESFASKRIDLYIHKIDQNIKADDLICKNNSIYIKRNNGRKK